MEAFVYQHFAELSALEVHHSNLAYSIFGRRRINTSPWYAFQVEESTDIDKKSILLVYVRYLYQEDNA